MSIRERFFKDYPHDAIFEVTLLAQLRYRLRRTHGVITFCDYIMQSFIVPCPLIGQRAMESQVIDEMFRERILHWTRMLDLFTCTMSTLVVLARVRAGPLLFARTHLANAATRQTNANLQHNQAIAYMQISRLNR